MVKLIWSPRAASDLEGICEYIARDSPYYARMVGKRIMEVLRFARKHPLMGQIVPEYGRPELRERRMQNYRVVYRIRGSAIEVVTISHAARLLPPIDLPRN